MALKDMDMAEVMRRLADKRIEDGMKAGKFDNLAGKGLPIVLDDMPAEENARLTWWVLRILRQNDFVPDEVRWRKQVDMLRSLLGRAKDEAEARMLAGQINGLVRKINTLGTNALKAPVAAVDVEAVVLSMRARSAEGAP